jgi:transposase
MAQDQAQAPSIPVRTLFVSLELASRSWKLAAADSQARKASQAVVSPFDPESLSHGLERARRKFGLPADSPVMLCMEAGRDGFSVHRWLAWLGMESIVIDPASVAVNRQKRRAKNDRLDALMLLGCLLRHGAGEEGVWRVCRVPSEEAEDLRQVHRSRKTLVEERTRHSNRIRSLLATQGVRVRVTPKLKDDLPSLRDPREKALGKHLQATLRRMLELLELLEEQIRGLDAEMRAWLAEQPGEDAGPSEAKVWRMAQLLGIGHVTAHTLVAELFGWREFSNRKEVGAVAGLTPTPYDTGESTREQGISKAGNNRVRALSIEAAWCWLRHQPESELSRWYRDKFLCGGKRQVRKGIVALARKLLIALWHWVEHDILPPGAVLVSTSPLRQNG